MAFHEISLGNSSSSFTKKANGVHINYVAISKNEKNE
jgi:hypothetical protein